MNTLHRYGILLAVSAILIASTVALANDDAARVKEARTEMLVGKGLVDRILERYPLFKHKVLEAYVNRVGQRIAAHAGRPEIGFQFAILDNDSFGSFAVPGGYVFITLGALNRLNDESELAAVLAHEIAHVTQQHLFEDLRPLIDDRLGFSTPPSAVSSAKFIKAATAQVSEKGVEILFGSGLPIEKEIDADCIAARLLPLAGYDASALRDHIIRLRDRVDAGIRPSGMTSDVLDRRLSSLYELLPETRIKLLRPIQANLQAVR